jgi:hypothetical protein
MFGLVVQLLPQQSQEIRNLQLKHTKPPLTANTAMKTNMPSIMKQSQIQISLSPPPLQLSRQRVAKQLKHSNKANQENSSHL